MTFAWNKHNGQRSKDLKMVWRRSNGAEAHLGMAVPGFPNFFMIYGPNTNLVIIQLYL